MPRLPGAGVCSEENLIAACRIPKEIGWEMECGVMTHLGRKSPLTR